MEKIVLGIIGAGWRTEFYLRIAKAMPESFEVSGVLVRKDERAREIETVWGVKTFRSVDEMLKASCPAFVVVSVSWEAAPVYTIELANRGVPVLMETPAAPDLDGLNQINRFAEGGAKIQVAEQYPFQPHHAARLALAASGMLGDISQAQLSCCFGYHAVSLMRKFLGVGYTNAKIRAREFVFPITEGPERFGAPKADRLIDSHQFIAEFDFGGKLGIYDFSDDQNFSWIRALHLLVRGTKGEIFDTKVRYLKDFRTPIELDLLRQNAGEYGNLEGYHLKGIIAGCEWVYKNPTAPARLADDEIAVADCLIRMFDYVNGGPGFYSLAEAAQDHYLLLSMWQAAKTGDVVETETQCWGK